jgi:hypothetical protein
MLPAVETAATTTQSRPSPTEEIVSEGRLCAFVAVTLVAGALAQSLRTVFNNEFWIQSR